jgi:hypothetical protein
MIAAANITMITPNIAKIIYSTLLPDLTFSSIAILPLACAHYIMTEVILHLDFGNAGQIFFCFIPDDYDKPTSTMHNKDNKKET